MATTPAEALRGLLFVDTNIWLYATDPDSPFHTRALAALDVAQDAGTTLVTSPRISMLPNVQHLRAVRLLLSHPSRAACARVGG